MAARKKQDFSAANMEPVYSSMAEAIAAPEAADVPGKSAKPAPQGVADVPEVDTAPIEPTEPETQEVKRKPRKTYTEEEIKDFTAQAMTRGRKGVRMPRINLAFYPDVYDYIITMARVRGQSLAEFVDATIRKDMKANAEIYQEAKAFIERMGG